PSPNASPPWGASPASTSTGSTTWRAPRTPASGSLRSAASPPSCSEPAGYRCVASRPLVEVLRRFEGLTDQVRPPVAAGGIEPFPETGLGRPEPVPRLGGGQAQDVADGLPARAAHPLGHH